MAKQRVSKTVLEGSSPSTLAIDAAWGFTDQARAIEITDSEGHTWTLLGAIRELNNKTMCAKCYQPCEVYESRSRYCGITKLSRCHGYRTFVFGANEK